MFKDNPTPTVPPADVPDALPELRGLIPLPRVPGLLPPSPRGGRYSVAQMYKAARVGARGRKLRTVKVLGRLFTTAEWVREFALGSADGAATAPAAPPPQAHARADRELAKAGW